MPLAVLLATACGHDDLVPDDVYVEETTPYVELRIAVPLANPSATRANPMGGEEGNGREQGILHEDDIHDINVIFFISEDGLNCSDNTEIIEHIYYNLDNLNDGENTKPLEDTEMIEGKVSYDSTNPYFGTGYVSLKFKCTEELIKKVKDINFAAIANAGFLQSFKGKTMKDVRDKVLSYKTDNAWNTTADAFSKDASKMNYFLMSTAYTDEYKYEGQSTGTNKFNISSDGKECLGTTTMQRLYARLDLWYNDSQIKEIGDGKELDYQIKDKDNTILKHHVFITNVLPVNVMQTPSYIFKRVTNTPDDNWLTNKAFWNKSSLSDVNSFTWGGRETPDAKISDVDISNDRPKNYVMERHTLDKYTLDELKLEENKQANETNLVNWYSNTRAGIVFENSDGADTGLGIKNKSNGKLSGYFDKDREKDDVYNCNHISIISYANENTHPTDCFHSNYLTGMAFRAIYVPEKIYSGSTTTTDADGTKTDNFTVAETVTGGKIYRYARTNRTPKEIYSIYFSNEDAAKAYDEAHSENMGVITSYDAYEHTNSDGTKQWGFICYYNLWLRHYNNESAEYQENFPMEYATVRNNIYRVAIDFSGPGDPEPTMREPDTMKARIFVRKWNYRKESEIIFD